MSENTEPLKDIKEALTSGRKPDVSHMRTPLLVYGARACEYGNDKYERANYRRPTQGGLGADFERYRTYLTATVRHCLATLDSMEMYQSQDPNLTGDGDAMKRACYAPDLDPDTSGKVGPSKLPHLCGAVASLNMAITQAVDAGLLPADPGQPWKAKEQAAEEETSAEMHDFNDANGPVPAHKHPNGGGWVADTAHVDATAYVGPNAWVSGSARVYGNARVYCDARVFGDAWVYGSAEVYGHAWVFGHARIFGNAQVYGSARVSGSAWVYGDARVFGHAWVSGDAEVYEGTRS